MNVNAGLIPLLFTICSGLLFAVFCTFCIAKPDKLAAYARRRYSRSSAFTQKIPFARIVMKDWYPTYLRLVGSFGLPFTIFWVYMVVTRLTSSR